ncbi:MAG: hypothetical protein AAB423_03350 [Patescibacteria group bacterium]
MRKKSTKTKKNQQIVDRRVVFIFMTILAISILAILGTLVLDKIDERKFQNLEKEKKSLVDSFNKTIGDRRVAENTKNTCFMAEQGPSDDGKLWCQVSTEIILSRNIDYVSVETNLPKDVSRCDVFYKNDQGKEEGSIVNAPENEPKHPYLIISCANRARKPHF